MLDTDVPQEGNSTLDGHKKVIYARGAEGKIEVVQSSGWEVEEIVTRQAVEAIERQADEARVRAQSGKTSPLEYHMYKARMDLPMLAQATGLWQWRIRRHFRPEVFARLKPSLLMLYAEVLGLSVAALQKIDP